MLPFISYRCFSGGASPSPTDIMFAKANISRLRCKHFTCVSKFHAPKGHFTARSAPPLPYRQHCPKPDFVKKGVVPRGHNAFCFGFHSGAALTLDFTFRLLALMPLLLRSLQALSLKAPARPSSHRTTSREGREFRWRPSERHSRKAP